jgi:putative endonuclease
MPSSLWAVQFASPKFSTDPEIPGAVSTKLRRGSQGERAAAKFLERRGYRILASNYRTRLGEIDLIAEDRGTLVFIEVKARTTDRFGAPAEAITSAKQARITRLAQQFLAARHLGDRPCRFDAVLISGDDPNGGRIELITAAFEVATHRLA